MVIEPWAGALMALVGGYLLGSIPFGLLLTRAAGAGDLRAIGSGNIGATNVLRTGRKGLAAATLILDALKGAAAVLIAAQFDPGWAPLAATGAFFGHLYPVWLRFRGGKGVAVMIGIALALHWPSGIAFMVVWAAAVAITRFSSVGGMAGAIATPVMAAWAGEFSLVLLFLAFALMLLWKHRDNLDRLLSGTDRRWARAARSHRLADEVNADRIARLRLIRTPTVGPVTYRQLLDRFANAQAAIEAIPDLARRGGGRPPQVTPLSVVEREVARVEALGGRYLFAGLGRYPALLGEIETAPPALIVRGDLRLFDRPAVAMVGARNASAAAIRFARGLALDLGREGRAIVSGLARGIDTAAHRGALETGTIAVIAGGIDVAYPPENATLQDEIATRGLLVAEMPPGVEPRGRHFPHRNRIIAGLAAGTVVVEAAPKSGSLITARLAGEQGREVMAVPGSPLDPRAQGCNLLIRDGATLVQSAADVLEALAPLALPRLASPRAPYASAPTDADERERAALVASLGPVPVPVDELVRQSGLAPGTVQTVLLELELGGRLERHAGGLVSLA